MTAHQLSIVLTTVPSREAADAIASALLEKRLAACVNILPGVVSRYWWEGTLETQEELLLIIKSPAELASELESTLKSVHPYSTPEMVVLSPTMVLDSYLTWALKECRPTTS